MTLPLDPGVFGDVGDVGSLPKSASDPNLACFVPALDSDAASDTCSLTALSSPELSESWDFPSSALSSASASAALSSAGASCPTSAFSPVTRVLGLLTSFSEVSTPSLFLFLGLPDSAAEAGLLGLPDSLPEDWSAFLVGVGLLPPLLSDTLPGGACLLGDLGVCFSF